MLPSLSRTLSARRRRTWDARTLWAHYRTAVIRTGGPDPGWPSDRELRTVYADVRGNRELIESREDLT